MTLRRRGITKGSVRICTGRAPLLETLMAETLTREQLYELVWTQPLKVLSTRFGVSDVTVKKCCAKSDIPTPDRGYWAKKEAGKHVIRTTLPLPTPGMSEDVVVAGGRQIPVSAMEQR